MQTLDTEHNHLNIRGRFAPSPSGRLHLGNLLSSLLAWLDVRALGGTMVFRLEDLDPERSYPEYANLMAEDLLWMGLDWDEGWTPNRNPEYTQGCRSTLYEDVFAQFQAQEQIYPCYCSRAQRLAASAPHPGEQQELGCHCRFLTEEEKRAFAKNHRKPAYKIRMDSRDIDFIDGHYGPQHFSMVAGQDDFIIRRADGVFAYQLAVSYDDAAMGITRVVRARDLLSSTPRQIWLIQKMGGIVPEYCHAPLLVAPDGRKLSKRDGDLNMEYFRQKYTPEELCGKLAYLAGIIDRPDAISANELVPLFRWDKVRKENIVIPNDLF